MFGPNHELAREREREVTLRLRDRGQEAELPQGRRVGRIRGLRRTDGSLWLFRLPRRATA
jgi:hypothetical protein